MCFSAEASFTSAGVLGILGLITLKKFPQKNILLIALTPLLFAIQQMLEGFVWLSFRDLETFANNAERFAEGYLFFVLFVWPIWIPFALLNAEKDKRRRLAISVSLFFGVVFDLIMLYHFFTLNYNEVSVEVVGRSLRYLYPMETPYSYLLLYCLATLLPNFFSSLWGMSFIGLFQLIGFFVAYYFYTEAFTSVWCFFAALVSVGAYFVLNENFEENISI